MTAQSALLSLTFVVLAPLIWQLRWVLLVLFGAVVMAVALDVLIHQLQDRSGLARSGPAPRHCWSYWRFCCWQV